MFPAFLLLYIISFPQYRHRNSDKNFSSFSLKKPDNLPQSDIFGTITLFFYHSGEIHPKYHARFIRFYTFSYPSFLIFPHTFVPGFLIYRYADAYRFQKESLTL